MPLLRGAHPTVSHSTENVEEPIMKTYEAGNTGVCQTGRIKIPAFDIRTSAKPVPGEIL